MAAPESPFSPGANYGPVLEVLFPVAATDRDIAHELGAVPDGYHLVMESHGNVFAVNVERWTDKLCWMRASVDFTRIRICFFKLPERTVIHVVP